MLRKTLDDNVAEVRCTYVSQWVSTKLQFTSSSLLLIQSEDGVGISIRQWCAENEVDFTSNQIYPYQSQKPETRDTYLSWGRMKVRRLVNPLCSPRLMGSKRQARMPVKREV
jgi:hypothetical protein